LISEVGQKRPSAVPGIRALQDLYKKDSWTRADRVAWEKHLSDTVSDRMRSAGFGGDRIHDLARLALTGKLNYLGDDIKNHKTGESFCCVEESVTGGVILQMAENGLLKDKKNPSMRPTSYYLTDGEQFDSGSMGRHQWVVSSATANPIEFTSSRLS